MYLNENVRAKIAYGRKCYRPFLKTVAFLTLSPLNILGSISEV